ncbi:MAG: phosphoribosylformylglycinamidine synthase subunit PurL [Actinomycetota bacterium]
MTDVNATTSPTVAPTFALVIGPGAVDSSANGLQAQAESFGFDVGSIRTLRLVHLRGDLSDTQLDELADRLLIDPVGQWWQHAADHLGGLEGDEPATRVVEVGLRPGVTDREGAELVRAAAELDLPVEVAGVGRRYLIASGDDDEAMAADDLERLAAQVLHNDVVERWAEGLLSPAFTDPSAKGGGIDTIAITGLDDDGLVEIGATRRLGMSLIELRAVQEHYREIGAEPTDGELETIAQTWSEHCSHKTFRGLLTTPEGQVDGLLKQYLRAATDAIDAPWVRSAFVDNAGIVAFDDTFDMAVKAETHNHPSALEPFGGSNTGVGGVVRDILGVSAKPVAITDILCFGPEGLAADDVPDGVLHPRRIRSGVIAGVGDYGNKIGVPTVAGAIIHDETYTTTPLVFAGCVGILPKGSHRTEPQAGDAIVVLGGAVGRDGVGGATFSSQSMGVETAEVAGSSVQIGDPIVEKGLIDVVCAARDAELYTAITDCGAGGLSSAVGEMAEHVGARVDLDLVPRKYPGLSPWEVWLSEAQERMVLAVPEPEAVLELARRWSVDAAVIGHFTGDGRLSVVDGSESLVDLDLGFLHDGRPRLELDAAPLATDRPDRSQVEIDPYAMVLRLLAHPSIRSNESVVRTYDHEVLGGTMTRPYGGVEGDGPADGAVLIPPGTSGDRGMVIGIGANVVIGRYDTEAMAWAAVDEAVRNAVASGADPKQLSLLDNFSWGNPTDPDTLARLIAATKGCHDAAIAYGAPFVSGKDSLYNEFVNPDGTRDPVTPTLIITALGIVDALDRVPVTGVVEAGDDVWLVGPAAGALGGSHLDDVLGADLGGAVPAPDPASGERHEQIHAAIGAGLARSVHDLAEGGLAVAAAEWALGGRLGLNLVPPDGSADFSTEELFGEGPARYLVEVAPADAEAFAALAPSARRLGTVSATGNVRIGGTLSVGLDRIHHAFVVEGQTPSAHDPSRGAAS